MYVLLTGGNGYIGANTAATLLENGRNVIIYDNLKNSTKDRLSQLEFTTSSHGTICGACEFVHGDVLDAQTLKQTFEKYDISSVIHCAALKSVPLSAQQPQLYYDVNVRGTWNLLSCCRKYAVKSFVFSSSAAVYGHDLTPPFKETDYLVPDSVYGETKLQGELLVQYYSKNPKPHLISNFKSLSLRYFNPLGARLDGTLGESPIQGANIMPSLLYSAKNNSPFTIYGRNYHTADGTAIRDYIHVTDIAQAHLRALQFLEEETTEASTTINLGSGDGYSVLELTKTFSNAYGTDIKIQFAKRREGDLAASYAAIEKAHTQLRWQPKLSLLQMCESAILATEK